MSGLAHEFMMFDSRDEATRFVTQFIAGGLTKALELKGTASLMVSGGSTPGPIFDALATTELDWARVMVGLVDENNGRHAAGSCGRQRQGVCPAL